MNAMTLALFCSYSMSILPHWAKSMLTDSYDVGSVPSVTGNVLGKIFDSIVSLELFQQRNQFIMQYNGSRNINHPS